MGQDSALETSSFLGSKGEWKSQKKQSTLPGIGGTAKATQFRHRSAQAMEQRIRGYGEIRTQKQEGFSDLKRNTGNTLDRLGGGQKFLLKKKKLKKKVRNGFSF